MTKSQRSSEQIVRNDHQMMISVRLATAAENFKNCLYIFDWTQSAHWDEIISKQILRAVAVTASVWMVRPRTS